MNASSTSGRLLAVGANFRNDENFAALKVYVTGDLQLTLTSSLQVLEDGKAVILFHRDIECLDVVTKIKHVINGHEVTFQDDTRLLNELPADSRQRSPFHGQTHSLGRGRGLLRMTNPSVTSIGIQDGGQTTSQTSQDRSPDGRSLTLFGDPTSAPSPGQFYSCGSIPHSVSPQKLEAAATSGPQVFGTSQGTGVPLHRFPLSINSANADQPYRSGTSGSRVFPSSQGTDGPLHKSPLSSNWAYTDPLMSYHPTEFRSSSPYRRPEMLAPQSPEKEVPTEGLNVIQIKGLPEHATPEDLKALLWESLSTNRTTKVNLEIARWAPEDTRVYFEDVKGVIGLWKNRHIRDLKYDTSQLSWDVLVEDGYEDDRILVGNLPNGITQYSVVLHLQSTGCIAPDIDLKTVFCSDHQEAVVFFSDSIADQKLVEDLVKEGSLYEGADDGSYTTLTFQLVPQTRTVQLDGLDPSVHKGTIRKYFQVLQQQENMKQPLLIEDIQTGRDDFPEGTALVKFRTVEGTRSVLQTAQLPPIGEQSRCPDVRLHHVYPASPVETKPPEERPETPEVETVEPIQYKPESPDIMNYIWKQGKHKKKLIDQLGCEEFSWDAGTVTIVGSSYTQEESVRKLEGFSDRYAAQTLYIKDSRLWEWSCSFIEAEKENRSSEVECIALQDQLAYKFIGPESEFNSLFQFCADKIGNRRHKLEEESEELHERLTIASNSHLELLKKSDEFKSVPDTCRVEPMSTANNVILDIKGPKAEVRAVKDAFLQFLNGLEIVSVGLTDPILRFLLQYNLNPLVAVLNDAKLEAVPTAIEEGSVRLVVKMTSREQVFKIAKEAFVTADLTDIEDDEVQRHLRSKDFARFMKSLSDNYDVLLELSRDKMEDATDSAVAVSVVGKKTVCQEVSKAISVFLTDTVIYTRQVTIEHPGCFRFVQRFNQPLIEETASRFSEYKTRIEISRRKALDNCPSVVFSCTKKGLSEVRKEIEKHTTLSRVDKTFSEHGLMRYFGTELFDTKRSGIEREHQVVIYLDFEDEDEDEIEVAATEMAVPKFPKSSGKIAEFTIREHPNRTIAIFAGDICHHKADAIVNAANENLEHTGGVARQISKTAGSIVEKESTDYIKRHGKLKVGSAMRTAPGALSNVKHIIHAVGPQWPGKVHLPGASKRAEEKLQEATRSCLELAQELGCTSLCFPAIGTGMFRCPSELVAKSMVKSAGNYLSQTKSTVVTQIHFILRIEDKENISCFQKECKATLGPSRTTEEKWKLGIPHMGSRIFAGPSSSGPARDLELLVASDSNSAAATAKIDAITVSSDLSLVKDRLNVSVIPGDITEAKVDIIINSTNGSLELDSAPASKAVSKVAGPQLQADCSDYVKGKGKLNTGGLVTTDAHRLPCKKVIHVVCPNSRKGLEELVFKCLIEADRLGQRSVAFPALGTGNLGMADEEAAKGILGGIDSYSLRGASNIVKVDVVVFDKDKLPKFQEVQRRQVAEVHPVPVPSRDIIQDNTVQLSNGVVLTVAQGDITTDNSDVIVAPTGIVLGEVLKIAPALNDDLKARYGGTPKPVADLTSSGKLACKRVFAIAVPSKGKRDNDESIKCIRDVVTQCLDMANSSGHSSISVPAIGTGKLGYTNVQTAAGIIEASKHFSSKTTNPKVKQIKVKVYDAHRVSDFQKELTSRTAGLVGGGGGLMHSMASGVYSGVAGTMKSVSSAVASVFSSDKGNETKSKKKKNRKGTSVKSMSLGKPDVVNVSVIGSLRSECDNVVGTLQKCIKESCIIITESFEHNIPEGFDTVALQAMAVENSVAVKLDIPEGSESPASITLSGFSEDVDKVHKDFLRRMTYAWKEEKEASDRERILEACTWLWQDDDDIYKECDESVVVELEMARETGKKTVKVSHRGAKVEVDLEKLQMKHGGKSWKVIRQDRGAGFHFPSTWKDPPAEGTHDYMLEKVPLTATDSEYKYVEKLFVQSGGQGSVVGILRIQNPKLYISYIQEKQTIMKRRQKQIQDGLATVERQLFHGTTNESIDHIMSCGFNRSYAGTAVGKLYGAGVYFADTAAGSSRYARANNSQERKMFLCDVLLGMSTVGTTTMLEPPVIDPSISSTDRYDSTVNNVSNPTIFVSCYRDNMAYPTYLISFK